MNIVASTHLHRIEKRNAVNVVDFFFHFQLEFRDSTIPTSFALLPFNSVCLCVCLCFIPVRRYLFIWSSRKWLQLVEIFRFDKYKQWKVCVANLQHTDCNTAHAMQAKIVYRAKIVQTGCLIRPTIEQRKKLKREWNETKRKAIEWIGMGENSHNMHGTHYFVVLIFSFFFFILFIFQKFACFTIHFCARCSFSDFNANRFHLSFWRFLKDFFRPKFCWSLLFFFASSSASS